MISKAKKESNRKRKSAPESTPSGPKRASKRSSPDSADETGVSAHPSKRKKVEANAEATNGQSSGTARKTIVESADLHPSALNKLLSELTAHPDAWPFLKPVNKKLVSAQTSYSQTLRLFQRCLIYILD